MQKRSTLGLLWVSFLLSFSIITYAQDGTLDPTFGNNGFAVNPTSATGVPLVLTQPDQKVIRIVGNQIIRNNADGSVDASFGSGGVVTIPSSIYVAPVDAVGLPDGKFVIAGTDAGGLAALRFNANGSPDASFDGDGKAVVMIGTAAARAFTLAVQPDGKIIVFGVTSQNSANVVAVVRFSTDGTLDSSFDGDGISMITAPNVYGQPAINTIGDNYSNRKSAAVQADGKIVVAFNFNNIQNRNGYEIARLNTDGSLDLNFNGVGYLASSQNNRDEVNVPLAIQPDGKIVFAYNSIVSDEARINVIRLNQDGSYDSSFPTLWLYNSTKNYIPTDIAIQQDGKIVLSGYTTCFSNNFTPPCTGFTRNDLLIARILSNGQPDGSFMGGNYLLNLSDSYQEIGGYLAPQGTKILMSASEQQSTVLRFNNSSPLLPRSPVLWYQDQDGDGYGSSTQTQVAYVVPAGYVSKGGDCNDGDAAIHPGATEVADGKDNDCNGVVDDVITYTTIPARIEAEAYSSQSGTQLEGTSDTGGGQNVGYIDQGDWLEYNVNASSAGTYSLNVRVASQMDGGTFEVRSSTGQVLASFTVPNTGGWQNWTTLTASIILPQGNQTLRLVSTSSANWNINWLEFTQGSTPPVTYVTIPARIEAETYYNQNGTQLENTSDAGGGQNVGWIDQGDWLDYNISAPAAGAYTVNFRVASTMDGAQFGIYNQQGQLLTTASVPNTGGWQAWTTISATLTLPQGDQSLRLYSSSAANWNINWMEFTQGSAPVTYVTIPAKIEAEAYSNQTGTQLEGTSDAGGGQNVGYIDQGDWLEYNIAVPTAGTYLLNVRVASQMSGGAFEVRTSSGQVLKSFTVPNTGSWQNWTTLADTLTLPAGNQTIRLVSTSTANWNINWLEFTQISTPPVTYVVIPAKIEAENYVNQNGTITEPTLDSSGGLDVTSIGNGDWLEYNIDVPTLGEYYMDIRLASATGNVLLNVDPAFGMPVTSIQVYQTGGDQVWYTWPIIITLPKGKATLRIRATGSGQVSLNWIAFRLKSAIDAIQLPGRVEAEAYSYQYRTQTEPTTDEGGGLNVGYIDRGDRLEYPIYAAIGGTYTISFRVASAMSGAQFQIDTRSSSATINVPNTGGWQNWTTVTVTLYNLSQGYQTLSIYSNSTANWNINWIDFALPGAPAKAAGTPIQSETRITPALNTLSVYPNPVRSALTLQVNNDKTGVMQVDVLDLSGRMQKRFSLNKGSASAATTLPLSGLPTGVYLLRVQMDGWIETRKIIKQ